MVIHAVLASPRNPAKYLHQECADREQTLAMRLIFYSSNYQIHWDQRSYLRCECFCFSLFQFLESSQLTKVALLACIFFNSGSDTISTNITFSSNTLSTCFSFIGHTFLSSSDLDDLLLFALLIDHLLSFKAFSFHQDSRCNDSKKGRNLPSLSLWILVATSFKNMWSWLTTDQQNLVRN